MKHWTITDDKNIKTSEILAEARKHFKVWTWDKYEKNIDKELPPPEETIEVTFLQSIESDKEHKGKSFDDFTSEKDKTYMTARQYLLLCIHVFKEKGEHLDVLGWTRTSSLWSDGSLVSGCWNPGNREVDLYFGDRDGRGTDGGPREQMKLTLKPSSSNPSTQNAGKDESLELAIKRVKKEGYVIYKPV